MFRYGGGLTYLKGVWGHFTHGLASSLSYTGRYDECYAADWHRVGMGGHVSKVVLDFEIFRNILEH